MQQDEYRQAIEGAGLELRTVQDNPQYHFISDSAARSDRNIRREERLLLATKPAQAS